MTPELIERLREGRAPFDGWTIQCEMMFLTDLRSPLTQLGHRLRSLGGSSDWVRIKDWFFHDECPSHPQAFDWNEFDRRVATDENMKSFCVGDDLCTFAIYPEDFAWLLHIDVPEEQENSSDWQGRFSLTGSLDLVRSMGEELTPFRLTFEPASRFFVPSWERPTLP